MILSDYDRAVVRYAVRRGSIGVSAVRTVCGCSDDRARWILNRLMHQGYLTPARSGGFIPTRKAHIEESGI